MGRSMVKPDHGKPMVQCYDYRENKIWNVINCISKTGSRMIRETSGAAMEGENAGDPSERGNAMRNKWIKWISGDG